MPKRRDDEHQEMDRDKESDEISRSWLSDCSRYVVMFGGVDEEGIGGQNEMQYNDNRIPVYILKES